MSTRIGLFYGSTTGNTEAAAELIKANLNQFTVDLFDIAETELTLTENYEFLIFGISTWEYGGLQDDWESRWESLTQQDFSGKIVAIFGQGDQVGYDEWFQDGIGILHDKLTEQGATAIGYWPNSGYHFTKSKGLSEDGSEFLGLSLDDDNQPELTEQRIDDWCQEIAAVLQELACETA
ncbi:flavodoxin FldB [Pseudoalteromonas sp. GCY]|uniref:flavodoxin FldB n=1 Tax=Pseudoalteromonas sp. GCY TaxID=2003316 RepID=UPI000BFEFE93|nr:flavodoxin FldB [Pseudoalteromonas sp. GCY]PHI38373.1 flavodoxin FldB [Pseudoalteromonas sp. GCY]QQQ65688.1 flavodoxin FldB [Pseudoalteromonas sp. GCY]